MECYTFIACLFQERVRMIQYTTQYVSHKWVILRAVIDTNVSTEWLPLKITASQNFVGLYVIVKL
jgi:hypothetical protein